MDLGQRVAEMQDSAPESHFDRERGRERWLGAVLSASWKRRAGRFAVPLELPGRVRWAAALAAAALVALTVMLARPRPPLGFEVGTAEVGNIGEWIASESAAASRVHFSDGSEFRLLPGGRARVTAVGANGAEVALERGVVAVSVVHREGARWIFRLGPFQVHVIGTRFELRWDPALEDFGVAVQVGEITVSGPVVGEARSVRANERLAISALKGTLEVTVLDGDATPFATPAPLASSAPTAENAAPSSSSPDTASPTLSRASHAPRITLERAAKLPRATSDDDADGWRTLADGGRYKDALAAADLEGFDAICASANAHDLRTLGDVARLGGSPARAARVFEQLRAQFPASPEAAAAAFLLGRIAQDQRRDYPAAAAWFGRYLVEQPGGEFSAEAAGRIVEVEDKSGDEVAAGRAAERYLALYPDGSHAGYARRVLARKER
jgi:hypothetical protein